ncbi:MAG: hypothetical protein HN736_19230 [Anaerolineae bacterium]|nr:hypothetical protein [Anaerolineae bacterium]MBT4308883.1 hypothetical protein [Anaerolineae bacterium]MBT4458690.1 hypothetical protein [Anaerolineae bacterium]MBT4841721.1 hypothetical protein [Anaerolineae bacterium]MBT6060602.1 hypothetical protein [Anaerolineae bacterium]
MTLMVVESLEKLKQRKIFTLLGVDYFITKRTWINLPLMLGVGIILAFVISPEDPANLKILSGVGYGLLIILSMFFHGIGHIISSRMVGAPVKSIVMTATVNVLRFEDSEEKPSRIHLGRSLGGPIFNLLVGIISIMIFNAVMASDFILFFGWVNMVFGVITLLPIPTLDGPVIFRELLNRNK